MSQVPFEIPNLDPRLKVYYEQKAKSVDSYLENYYEGQGAEFALAFICGFGVALGHIIEDLNDAAMGAAFDAIVDKLK
jgi:hypothetical protein